MSRACRSKGKGKQEGGNQRKQWSKGKPTYHFSEHHPNSEDSSEEESPPPIYSLFTFGQKNTTPYKVKLSINRKTVDVEVDTGASLSIISKATYAYLQSQERSSPLQGTECSAPYIRWEGKEGPLLVVIEKDPALLGRNCLGGLHLNWHLVKQSSSVNQRLEKVVQNYSHLFKEGRGTLQGVKAKIHVDSSDTSVFYKARPVPYTLRDKIEHAISKY